MASPDLRPIRRALLSVSDKTALVELARTLQEFGVELISTGGTWKALHEAGLKVQEIAEVTGFPEMLDGRVKTLHPRIHAGILAVRADAQHMATLAKHEIEPIDLVIVNLYPFEATVQKPGVGHDEIVENIDIGGPTIVRAACKNYHDVAVVVDPSQYAALTAELTERHGQLSLATRERLAAAAFGRIAAYDAAIARYFAGRQAETFSELLTLSFDRKMKLRYGENPHQDAAFYIDRLGSAGIGRAKIRHGKELSFNNILDLESAWNLVAEFAEPAVVVVKHNNPCGAAVASSLSVAFDRAYAGDPVSAFGGILAFNRPVDVATANLITEPNRFIECIVAPAFEPEAFEILTTRPSWKKNVRLLEAVLPTAKSSSILDYRPVTGGLLVQSRDSQTDDWSSVRTVTKRAPSSQETADLKLAWIVCKHVKSNAIVLAKDQMLVGVGAGQMSRVDSVHMAARKAGERSQGSVLASDAFFPFRDNVDLAAAAGVKAIVQPGGSIRDQDSIAACDENEIAMIFTGVRHFRH
ncbi:MAG TPA: bifunctional phosphoribosylaminoimidazolecarboxamide formyltransferase/IMP cyclohydrolase [Gemmataceae bacterium]|jgi:phosphoribosylaminoimidazolecarboxamide formyltransferase/IMP cyclohydrolase|nr:bifunctional phosphoribosylaminoimidazolecarboxamide formyltransferase/IMP cyclohydrolase [Gemmataceae bacterium]